MKAIVPIVLAAIFCAVIFVIAVVSPRKAKKVKRCSDRLFKKGERKSDEKAGRLGDATQKALEKTRHAVDKSSRAGTKVHEGIKERFDRDRGPDCYAWVRSTPCPGRPAGKATDGPPRSTPEGCAARFRMER